LYLYLNAIETTYNKIAAKVENSYSFISKPIY